MILAIGKWYPSGVTATGNGHQKARIFGEECGSGGNLFTGEREQNVAHGDMRDR